MIVDPITTRPERMGTARRPPARAPRHVRMVLAPPGGGNLGSGAGRAAPRHDRGMEVLSSRILLRPSNPEGSRRFYRDILGLAVYREFGPPEDPGLVFFLGQGLLEVSGTSHGEPAGPLRIWLQVRDVRAEHERLVAAGVTVTREPRPEPWGLVEMWIEDPDGVRIVFVEVPTRCGVTQGDLSAVRILRGNTHERSAGK